MLQEIWDCWYIFKILLSVLLGKYSETQLLDHTVVVFFFFLGTIMFFIATAPFCILPTECKGFSFSTIYPTLIFCFYNGHPNKYKLIFHISLLSIIISYVENLFIYPFVFSLWKKMCAQHVCTFFNQVIYFFYWAVGGPQIS